MDTRNDLPIGPWAGLNELGSGPETIVRCLNVDFEDGRIRRRRGRQLLAILKNGVPMTGLFQHVGLEGERVLLAGFTPTAPLSGYPAIGTADSGFTELALPSTGQRAEPAARYAFTAYKGRTMVADPYGRIIDYDGASGASLPAVQGNDAASGLAGARSYLAVPPRASSVAVWFGRLVAAQGRTVGISAYPTDPAVPASARAGGASVWPVRTNVDVVARDGDEIQGLAVADDALVVLTRRGVGIISEGDADIVPAVRIRPARGCIAPASIQTVEKNGSTYVLYLAEGKVCAWNGAASEDISAPITETLKAVTWAAASGAVSAHYRKKNEYWLWLPVYGEVTNRLCAIFNYVRNEWKLYAGWYPWDTNARQDLGSGYPYDVTAAASVLTTSGEEVLLTGNAGGQLWREDVGEVDGAYIFPAFAMPGALGSGEREFTFRDWRIDALHDGSFVEGIALMDGVPLEQELDRIQNAQATLSERVVTRALQGPTHGGAGAAFPITGHGKKTDALRLGFGRRGRRMHPVISLPGQSGAVYDTTLGGVRLLEVSLEARKGGR